MGSNSFGNLFKITTWGESHGSAIGVVIDGCPAGLSLTQADIQKELDLRRPGNNCYTSPRQEKDHVEVLSGIFEEKTTGAPISLLIKNHDANSQSYETLKNVLRPGHANFTYLQKYGIFDYRGGGRASARETASRVAAGAIAKKFLAHHGIKGIAYVKSIGSIDVEIESLNEAVIKESPLFCPDKKKEALMACLLEKMMHEGDSVGGIVEMVIDGMPIGLGDPVYEKLEANLAKGMLSIPATKGIEFGAGFEAARMQGSQHNDLFRVDRGRVVTKTNHAGGTLGGISNGMPLVFRVAFKPASSIRKAQTTLNLQNEEVQWNLPEGSRHDPCVAIRGVPVVEAMGALVVADALLMNRLCLVDIG